MDNLCFLFWRALGTSQANTAYDDDYGRLEPLADCVACAFVVHDGTNMDMLVMLLT